VKADKENAPTEIYAAIAETTCTLISAEMKNLQDASHQSPSLSSSTATSTSTSISTSTSAAIAISCNKILLRPAPHHPSSANQSAFIPPRLLRSSSENSKRSICSDVNPNTCPSSKHPAAASAYRASALSAEEKVSNLQFLNSTLVKEVSSLRSSQSQIRSLQTQLQSTMYRADSLMREKEELEEDVENIRSEMSEKIEAQKKAAALAEDRLQSVTAMVDNLQSTNDRLAAEAARLKEEAAVSMSDRKTLMDEMEKIWGEKSVLEEMVESFR
jgi:hypothetical protein